MFKFVYQGKDEHTLAGVGIVKPGQPFDVTIIQAAQLEAQEDSLYKRVEEPAPVIEPPVGSETKQTPAGEKSSKAEDKTQKATAPKNTGNRRTSKKAEPESAPAVESASPSASTESQPAGDPVSPAQSDEQSASGEQPAIVESAASTEAPATESASAPVIEQPAAEQPATVDAQPPANNTPPAT